MVHRTVLDVGLGDSHRSYQQAAVLPDMVIQDTRCHDDHLARAWYCASVHRSPLGDHRGRCRYRDTALVTALDAVHRMRLLLRCTLHQETHAEDTRLFRLLKHIRAFGPTLSLFNDEPNVISQKQLLISSTFGIFAGERSCLRLPNSGT